MGKYKTRNLLTVIPTALMLASHWEIATAQAPAAQQEGRQSTHYADGVYTAKGTYGGGPSFLVVTVTLKDGVISTVKVEPQATVPRSLEFQRAFAAAVPKVVVGRPIDRLQVGKLAGSSGTPQGFNDALRQIREQAAQ
jgi:uncharacterized protein with FMN-binding domain